MPNVNSQTFHQMGGINDVFRQAIGLDNTQNIEMDWVTVAQNKRAYPVSSYMGNPLSFMAEKAGYLGAVNLEFKVKQNLNGYEYPWPAGGSKNKMANAQPKILTSNGITISLDAKGVFTITGTSTAAVVFDFPIGYDYVIISGDPSPRFCMNNTQAQTDISFKFMYQGAVVDSWVMSPANRINQYVNMQNRLCDGYQIRVENGVTVDMTVSPVLQAYDVVGSGFVPYSNISPITGRTNATVTANGEDFTTDFPQPVYAGTLNMATGELTISRVCVRLGDYEWTRDTSYSRFYHSFSDIMYGVPTRTLEVVSSHFLSITDGRPAAQVPLNSIYTVGSSNRNVYISTDITDPAEFTAAYADAQICYPLMREIIMQVPKQIIPTIIGENTVSTDADLLEVTLYYLEDI